MWWSFLGFGLLCEAAVRWFTLYLARQSRRHGPSGPSVMVVALAPVLAVVFVVRVVGILAAFALASQQGGRVGATVLLAVGSAWSAAMVWGILSEIRSSRRDG